MHQQVRCSIKSASNDAARGAVDDVSLVEILTLLKNTNLRSAGRIRFDDGRELKAIIHEDVARHAYVIVNGDSVRVRFNDIGWPSVVELIHNSN